MFKIELYVAYQDSGLAGKIIRTITTHTVVFFINQKINVV